jgi:outer membrane protein assembly factor BamB
MLRYFVGLCCLVVAIPAVAADWPAFRGPQGNGVSTEQTAPLEWSPTKNVKWKAELSQPGNGSPIVSGSLVFVTAVEDPKGYGRSLYAFDRESGDLAWKNTVNFDQDDPTHDTNPYAGTTPAADGKHVVVWHSSAGLYCYDFEGKQLWTKDLGQFRHMWGYGTSPVIYKDRVILHSGPGKQVFVAAFDLASGNELWRQNEELEGDGEHRPDKAYMGSWATPVIAELNGRDHLICAMPTRLVSYDPQSGEILWTCDGLRGPKGDLAYSSPVLAGNICVQTGGFNGPALAVEIKGKGDITEHRLWRQESSPQSIGSGVVVDGYFYRPNAGPGTIDCIDPKTGKVLWSERTGTFWGSIVHVAGRCYVTAQDGTTFVFKPSPEKFELLARNALREPSNATPAISNGEFFVRTHKGLFCIGEK